MMIEFKGRWIDRKTYRWEPQGRYATSTDEFWYVPCGCDLHGDHAACERDCRLSGQCLHPRGVQVSVQKMTPSGAVEYRMTKNKPLEGKRPPKKKSPKSVELGWKHTLQYAATALEGSADQGDLYCAAQIREYLRQEF